MQNDEVDRFQLDDVHFCFLWQSAALGESDFLKAIYLELKADNPEKMKQKISVSRRACGNCSPRIKAPHGGGRRQESAEKAGVQTR
jgi:hypothetical protein